MLAMFRSVSKDGPSCGVHGKKITFRCLYFLSPGGCYQKFISILSSMKKISIVIPVYNEKPTLEEIIRRILEADTLGLEKEIVLVDDFSTDGSREIVESYRDRPGFLVAFQEKNQGKGAALRKGFDMATGDAVLIQDADLEYSPSDYAGMLEPMIDERADVVYGSRFVSPAAHRVQYFLHYVFNKAFTFMSNMLTNVNLTDVETCYKVIRMDTLKKITLKENKFSIDPELTAKLTRIPGVRIYEVGVSYNGRTYEEGKKITLKDAFQAGYCLIKYNLNVKNIVLLLVLFAIFLVIIL